MRAKISKITFQFLQDLKNNNDRYWFNDNKPRFEEARKEFTSFIGELIMEIAKFDPPIASLDPRESTFRIHRDIRFSKDKTPYKTNLGAHLVACAEKPHDRAGYYIHLQPKNSFLAGGAYQPPAQWLKAIRQGIDRNGRDFTQLLSSASFKKYFGEMQGEKLKTKPRHYSEDHPHIELLRHKSFLAVHKVSQEDCVSEAFLEHCAHVFKELKPFNDFLNRSLDQHKSLQNSRQHDNVTFEKIPDFGG